MLFRSIGNGSDSLSLTLKEEILQMDHCVQNCIAFIDELLQAGYQQGKIREMDQKTARMAMVSQISGLILCLMHPEIDPDLGAKEAAEITYRNILRLLEG